MLSKGYQGLSKGYFTRSCSVRRYSMENFCKILKKSSQAVTSYIYIFIYIYFKIYMRAIRAIRVIRIIRVIKGYLAEIGHCVFHLISDSNIYTYIHIYTERYIYGPVGLFLRVNKGYS